MKNNLKKLDDVSIQIDVTVEFADFKGVVDNVYAKLREDVKMPGFRKGHVPNNVINQRVGTSYIIEEVTNQVISQYYREVALDNELRVMGNPDIKVKSGYSLIDDTKPIEFTATVEVRPTIKIPDLSGQEFEITVPKIKESEVDERLEFIRNNESITNQAGEKEALDDEELMTVIGANSVENMREITRKQIEETNMSSVVRQAGDKVLDYLNDTLKFTVPPKALNLAVDNFLSTSSTGPNTDKETLKEPTVKELEDARVRAEKDIHSQILLDTYADENGIKVEQEEIVNYLANMSMQYGLDPNQFIQMMMQNGQLPAAAAEVSRSKTLAHMLRCIKVVDQNKNELDLSQWIGIKENDDVEVEKE